MSLFFLCRSSLFFERPFSTLLRCSFYENYKKKKKFRWFSRVSLSTSKSEVYTCTIPTITTTTRYVRSSVSNVAFAVKVSPSSGQLVWFWRTGVGGSRRQHITGKIAPKIHFKTKIIWIIVVMLCMFECASSFSFSRANTSTICIHTKRKFKTVLFHSLQPQNCIFGTI